MFRGYRKTKKNIKKIENTIDFICVQIYNIDKLKESYKTIKKADCWNSPRRSIRYYPTKANKRKERYYFTR